MKKKFTDREIFPQNFLSQLFLTMKLTIFFLITSVLGLFATESYSQVTLITLDLKSVMVKDVLKAIENESEFYFIFNNELINVDREIDISVKNQKITEVLNTIFEGRDVEITVIDRKIVLAPAFMGEQQPGKKIAGKVTDSSGATLPGVSVVIKGTTLGFITDNDGNFSLSNVSESAVLQFSFVGMKMQEIAVGNKTTINVMLVEDAIGIEEVVAVGYGIQKKVNLTGSVGVVDAKKLENRSITRLEQGLQGQVAGLKIAQTAAQPGNEQISLEIRGKSTFTSNPVLTIIDGMPSSLNQINSNDIESISVLKDASSTAIYGARAAGGVILITTKKGKIGKPQVSYDGYVGIQRATRIPEKVTAFEHATLFNEAQKNDNPNTTLFRYTSDDLKRFSSPDWVDHNWLEAILSDALQTQHNISVSGGSENNSYYLSMGYYSQDGIVMNTGYDKYTLQYNQNIKLSEKLKLSFNGSFAPDKRTAPTTAVVTTDGGVRGVDALLNRAYRWGNQIPYMTSKGNYTTVEGIEPSMLGMASKERGQQILKRNSVSGNFGLDYSVTKDLKVTGMYGIIFKQNRQRDYSAKMKFYDPVNEDLVTWDCNENALIIENSSSTFQNAQFLVNFGKKIGDHSFSALAGYTKEWSYDDNELVGRRDFLTDNIYTISAGSEDRTKWTTSGSAVDWALASFIGRANYSYKDKYLAEAAIRYDGSSKFISDVRWGVFPSVSAGWRLTEEDFLKDNNILTNLKLRASWGQVGNQNIGNYQFASTLSIGNYYFNDLVQKAVYSTVSPNPQLTWETKTGSNIGLDGSIKNGLFSFVFDLFKERTTDILLNVPVPTTFGKGTPIQNAGIVDNTGWEMELSHRKTIRDFSYGITFQVSDATNKVIDLQGTGPWIASNTITEEGHPMYEWFGLKSEGYFQTADEVTNSSFQSVQAGPGDLKYQENGGDAKKISPDDRVRLGRSDARFPFGIRFDIKYKGFDLSAFGQGVMSQKVFNNGWTAYNFDRTYSTLYTYHLDRWTPENTDSRFPRTHIGGASLNAQFSSFWLENAAYFRMKNLQIGYNLPQSVLSMLKLSKVRIYLSGENLFTITNLLGFDPEIPGGITTRLVENRYPLSKNYFVGININF